jgi:NADH:ubiquinone oxidoreductase subunit 4 (subunit M)
VIIWLGVYPKPVLDRMQPAAERFVQQVQSSAEAAQMAWRGGR